MTPHPSIVITGTGLVLPCGLSAAAAWDAVRAGRTGIGPLRRFDLGSVPCRATAEVPSFSLDGALRQAKHEKLMSPAVRCGLRAAIDAVAKSRIDLATLDPFRIALHVGSGETGLEGADFFKALAFARSTPDPMPSHSWAAVPPGS